MGALLQYYSSTHQQWLRSVVTAASRDAFQIDLKPGVWILAEELTKPHSRVKYMEPPPELSTAPYVRQPAGRVAAAPLVPAGCEGAVQRGKPVGSGHLV